MSDMEEEIIDDNRILLRDYSLFDESSREFVRGLLRKLEKLDHSSHIHQLQSKILNLVWKYLASIWARTKELPDFEEALSYLQSICASCNQCCYISLRWLISSQRKSWNMMEDEDILRDLILKISQPKVRQLTRSFIVQALKQLRANPDMYGADTTNHEPDIQGNGAIAIVTRLAQFIPDSLHMNFRAWEDFFGLLADIAGLGAQESYALILDGVLTACFEALLCNLSYNDTVDRRYYNVNEMLKRKLAPSYNQLIRLTAVLFNHVNMRAEAVAEADTFQRLEYFTGGGVPWTDYEETLLLDFNKKEGGLMWLCEVFQKWNFEGEGFAPGEIVRSLLTAKSAVIHGVIETFTINIKEFESRYADPFLRSAKSIPMYLMNRDLVEKFMKFMKQCSRDANSTSARGDDGYNGFYCFRFWSALHQMAMGNLVSRIDDPAFFDKMFLDYSREWAPSLLMYRKDWEVGRLTQRLVQDGIFKTWGKLVDEDVRDMNDQDNAVMLLFWSCDRQIRMLYDERPWRQFMVPLYTVMHECASFIKVIAGDEQDRDPDAITEDEKILSRFDGT
jgi:ubiquitin carboxyl-terminal hydrolase 34